MEKKLKSIIIFGASGMIGHQIFLKLSSNPNFKLYPYFHEYPFPASGKSIDVRDINLVTAEINRIDPDWIINCSGKLIEDSDNNFYEAVQVNSIFPRHLELLSRELKFQLVQISTDCVFSGLNGPYNILSYKDGSSNYSISKGLGEIIDCKNLTIRTSVIGPDLKQKSSELMHWLFFNGEKNIQGFSNAIWSGITSMQLARAVEFLMENKITGLVHMSKSEPISKYELLKILINTFDLKIDIEPVLVPVNNKVLLSEDSKFDLQFPSYEEMILELKKFMNQSNLYKHYFATIN